MSLVKVLKKNRPSVSLGTLGETGVPALNSAIDSDIGFSTYLKRLQFAAGVNHIIQVFDCEAVTGVDESDSGTFDIAAAAAAGKRVGTNCMKLIATAACDGTQYVDVTYINETEPAPEVFGLKQMDWSDTDYIGFWNSTASSGDFGTAGEMKIALVYNGGLVSDSQNVPATVTTVHQWAEFALSDFGIELDKIEAVRFYCSNANVGEYVQYDDIQRYLISYNGAPLYGCAFPIKSGITLTNKSTVKWSVDGLDLSDGAADPHNLGAVELFASSLLGDSKRSKWGMWKGAEIIIVRAGTGATAGDLLEWESDRHYNDVTTTAVKEGMVMALESAGAAEDDIFALCIHGHAIA